MAGAASLAYEYYGRVLKPGQTPSPAMLKALLLNSPRYLDGVGTGGTLPSNDQGWGDVNLGTLFDGTPRVIADQGSVLAATGSRYSASGAISNAAQPFRVSLVWTDAPGTTTGNAYVNDLNLQVTVGGQIYKGNVFSGANSILGGAFDPKNNTENVFIPAGTSGTFSVQVIGANIAGDGVPGNADGTDQDFALVIYNGTAIPVTVLDVAAVDLDDASGNNNNVMEPGEIVALRPSITNLGTLTASGISGGLSVVSGNVTIFNGTTTYANTAENETHAATFPRQQQSSMWYADCAA